MLNTVQLLRCRNMQPRRQFNGHLMRIWISVVLLIQWKQTLVLQSNKKSISVELSFQSSTLFFSPLLCKKKSDSWCRWAAGRILVWSNDLNRKNKRKKKIKLNFKKTKEKKKKASKFSAAQMPTAFFLTLLPTVYQPPLPPFFFFCGAFLRVAPEDDGFCCRGGTTPLAGAVEEPDADPGLGEVGGLLAVLLASLKREKSHSAVRRAGKL